MTLYITEYARLAKDANGNTMPIGEEPAVAHQTVSTSLTPAQSAVFNSATKFVSVYADEAVYMVFGATPTTNGAQLPLSAGAQRFHGLGPQGLRLSVVAAA